MDTQRFNTCSLSNHVHGERVRRILAAAIEAVDPRNAVKKNMQRVGTQLQIGGRSYDLTSIRQIFLVSFGKASLPMAEAAVEILGDHLTAGYVIPKAAGNDEMRTMPGHPLTSMPASHPVPDERGVAAAQKVIELLKTTTEDDLIICLISGGGSALLTSPAEGISLDHIQSLTKSLLGCGATINEINTLRKHLSQVKGGQLARLGAPSQMAALILSDVIGDPLDVISSGPTVPDPTSFQEALDILEKYALVEVVADPIVDHLKRGAAGLIPDTPKEGDPLFERVWNVIVGNNERAAQAALCQAQQEGLRTLLLTTCLHGEARNAGEMMASVARQVSEAGTPIPRPACIVAGGETTVSIQGDGLGGRNQELALGAVAGMAGLERTLLVALATDGDDGPTDAAGAVVTGETLSRAMSSGLDPAEFLARNDAYHFFEPLGDLLKTGPTQTNVCDLTFIFVF